MSAPSPGIERVAVIGAGLVGGSIALAARDAGVEQVRLTDADAAVRERAAALGLGDEVCETIERAVRDAHLVVAAVPAGAVADVLTVAAAHAPPDAILTDAASLKRDLTLEVQSRLREGAGGLEGGPLAPAVRRFVAGHPMAGSERSGPEAADAALFHGATWILTPTAATDDQVLEALSRFLRRLGARVVAVSPELHDELVAVVSHLPQLAASALADVAADAATAAGEVVLAVAGGGFRDTTRIAASDPALWIGILSGNRGAVLEALDAYRGRLDQLRAALATGDEDGLMRILLRASEARRRMVPKAGTVDVVDVVVSLADRPGALGLATTALGEAGVNVEDVAMRHAVEGERGALLLRVAAPQADRAVEVLVGRGLAAHVEGRLAGDLDEPT